MPFESQMLLIGLVFGIYIGLIFITKNGIKVNGSILLSAWLPSFIISIYLPLTYGVEMMLGHHHLYAPYQIWFFRNTGYDLFPIVTGITLMAGLFTGHKQIRAKK
jgi:hypothetical protein